MMNRFDFLDQLKQLLPEAYAVIDTSDELLHCEMADFRKWVELQMTLRADWNCQKAFEFIVHCSKNADSNLENAIEVSFIEDLALGEHLSEYKVVVKERAPKDLRDRLSSISKFWA